MTNLVSAYQNNDINEFEKILKNNRRNIMDDPFIREHIEGMVFWYQEDLFLNFVRTFHFVYLKIEDLAVTIEVCIVM